MNGIAGERHEHGMLCVNPPLTAALEKIKLSEEDSRKYIQFLEPGHVLHKRPRGNTMYFEINLAVLTFHGTL
jgi:hypothetical protein